MRRSPLRHAGLVPELWSGLPGHGAQPAGRVHAPARFVAEASKTPAPLRTAQCRYKILFGRQIPGHGGKEPLSTKFPYVPLYNPRAPKVCSSSLAFQISPTSSRLTSTQLDPSRNCSRSKQVARRLRGLSPSPAKTRSDNSECPAVQPTTNFRSLPKDHLDPPRHSGRRRCPVGASPIRPFYTLPISC